MSGVKTYYLYDGGEPIVELSPTGSVTAVNVFAPDGLVARQQSGSRIQYAFDPQGNVAQRLNSTGTVQSSSAYDAYGAETSVGTIPTDPFGYNARAGYLQDRDTGLVLCGQRYYDPGTGRWLNRDPLGYPGGVNLFGYCQGRPVNHADPSGLLCLTSVDCYCQRFPSFCVALGIQIEKGSENAGVGFGSPVTQEEVSNAVQTISGVKNQSTFTDAAHWVLENTVKNSGEPGWEIEQDCPGVGQMDAINSITKTILDFKTAGGGGSGGESQMSGFVNAHPGYSGQIIPYPVPWRPDFWDGLPPGWYF